ncbi:CRAL-TRIO domain containing protein [Nitzschia inconspicua]|uniref:CRAL-TRIO domain containing protein n=1 Tax=Nitzschia inconspicua TaxID=303405 RepID=A0A9K3LIS4_9STRA|nr:CRAL-TRIO domain containing protein [Nitzschia inconspicua]
MMQHLTTFLSILKNPPIFESDDDNESCSEILDTFTTEEVEEIACTSYAYWIVSTKIPEQLPELARTNSALKEIRRFYIGEGKTIAKTIVSLKAALEYRREYRVDILRSCFYENENGNMDLSNNYKTLIFQDLERQPTIVQGVDSKERIVVYKPPRRSNPAGADEAFLLTQLYTSERAIANAEFQQKEEKLCAIFNFKDYSSSHSPSTTTMVTLVKVLQTCYPERLGTLTVLEAPFWMRAIINIVWLFLSTATSEKIQMTSEIPDDLLKPPNDYKLQQMISHPDQTHVDLKEYTERPFYCVDE